MFAEDEARLLLDAAATPAGIDELVRRRCAGEPLEHLLGWVEFDGRRLVVAPGVFVPRRRTALLARLALERLPQRGLAVELCCGTAAIAAVLAADRPHAAVHASDIDPVAVACARRNLGGGDRFVHEGDLFAALPDTLRRRVDVLVVNAPYVPTAAIASMPPEAREHEPRIALDGGPEGTAVHARIAAGARQWLAPGGCVIVETGAVQARRTAALFGDAGLAADIVRDDDLDATAVLATTAPDREGGGGW